MEGVGGKKERERERESDLTAMHNYLSLRSGGERHLIIISLSWAHIIHCTSHGSIQKVLWELRLLLKQKYVKEFGALSLNRSDCKLSLSLSPSPSLLSWNSSAIIRLSAQPQTHQKNTQRTRLGVLIINPLKFGIFRLVIVTIPTVKPLTKQQVNAKE